MSYGTRVFLCVFFVDFPERVLLSLARTCFFAFLNLRECVGINVFDLEYL